MTVEAVCLLVATALMALMTVVPMSRIPHGFVRGMEFPRLQILAVCGVLLAAALALLDGPLRFWIALTLAAVIVVQAVNVARFTFLWRRQSRRARGDDETDLGARVSVLAANVKMSNRAYSSLLDLVRDEAPDILVALEVDDRWVEAIRAIAGDYRHHVERPQDNGYGMLVYSRLPMAAIEVRELVVDLVPSVRAVVRTRNGRAFRFYAIHPEPPVPYAGSEGRDAEIALVGLEAKADRLPALVVGDINDVAWSATTRRFQRLSGLLDPRVGRGFYNTFDARFPFLRWPLDHLFHDPDFRLVDMRRGPKIGSDHFPMLFSVALTGTEAAHDMPEEADPEEREEVEEMIERERGTRREAIGSDWERD